MEWPAHLPLEGGGGVSLSPVHLVPMLIPSFEVLFLHPLFVSSSLSPKLSKMIPFFLKTNKK